MAIHDGDGGCAQPAVMVFDGDCGFCRAWIERWRQMTRDRVRYVPYQQAAVEFPQVPREAFAEAVHLIEPDGSVRRGAAAVLRARAIAGRHGLMFLYRRLPPFRWASDLAYRFIARRRGLGAWFTSVFFGASAARSTYALANHIGLRALGIIYFLALVSYWVQADGLIGRDGILPCAAWLQAIRPQVAAVGYWHVPTLLWFHPSDGFLHLTFGVGVLCSVLLVAGFLPLFNTLALWAIYLSLTIAGRRFLGFQWDNLLLEAGLLAVLAAPWRWRLRWGRDPEPPRLAVLLYHWLAFRLMFSSGFVKLASQDPSWWHLTALTFHYWTQPIPTWTAWYMNLLPLWFQRFSCFIMFVIELGFPFLIWLPRRPRHLAAAGIITLMLIIAATGNYTYFNWLTITLCFWLIDDRAWASMLRHRRSGAVPDSPPAPVAHRVAILLPGLAILLVSAMTFAGTVHVRVRWPMWTIRLYQAADPLRSVNSYGLFAAMTKTRPEIVIEGTPDGEHWFPYEFKWKPGDLSRAPPFVAPHQPRLDWQMWFAALGSREGNPWFMSLLVRLLENAPPVVALLEHNPFPEKPPVAVRAVLYDYRFTTRAERRATGNWWIREAKGLYCPSVRLNHSAGDP